MPTIIIGAMNRKGENTIPDITSEQLSWVGELTIIQKQQIRQDETMNRPTKEIIVTAVNDRTWNARNPIVSSTDPVELLPRWAQSVHVRLPVFFASSAETLTSSRFRFERIFKTTLWFVVTEMISSLLHYSLGRESKMYILDFNFLRFWTIFLALSKSFGFCWKGCANHHARLRHLFKVF